MIPADFAPAASKKALLRLCAALCAAVLTISLLPQLAAAEAAFSLEMTPQMAGNTAAMSGQRVTFDGTAPAGATKIQFGEWLALDAHGQEIAIPESEKEYVPSSALNALGIELGSVGTQNDFIRIENGGFTGQLTLPPCTYSDPAPEPDPNGGSTAEPCAPDGVRKAVLRLTVGTAEGNVTGDSSAVRVDYTRPRIQRYEMIGTDAIRVVFSEPVRLPDGQSELGTDWEITPEHASTSVPAAAVKPAAGNDCTLATIADPSAGMTGCTRTLQMSQLLDQDEKPFVEYTNSESAVPGRTPYIDGAGSRLRGAIGFGSTQSADLVRPVAPHIQSVDGKTGSDAIIVSNGPSPAVRLTNLTGGHVAELTVQRPSGTTVVLTERVPDGATSLDLTVPASNDGKYTLSAVAIDTNGNRSDDTTKNAPALARDGARPSVAYVLDTVAPQILTADLKDRRTVALRFTEAILPDDDAGNWFVGDVPVTAVGSGDTRALKSSIDLTKPGAVRWQPTSTQPGSVGRYGDQAGNGMAAVSGIALADLPPVQAPSVTSPTRVTYTKASGIRIAGTGPTRSGLAVDLFEQGGTKALRSSAVNSGKWSIDQALDADGRYLFAVQLRDTQTGAVSPRVPVADIVRDTVAPKVTVHAPTEGGIGDLFGTPQEYGVGDAVTVRWTATDTANDPVRPDHGRQATIFLVDEESGSRRAVKTGIQHQAGQEQSASYTLKAADLAGQGRRDLHFDVAVSDVAGNVGQSSSGTIRLLDTLIGYRAVLTDLTVEGSSVIEARFPVELQGTTTAIDWLVNGEMPLTAEKTSPRLVTLTVPLSDDPNAVHTVVYQPSLSNLNQLEDANGRLVSTAPRNAIDRIIPALTTRRPQTPKVVDRYKVRFSGTTDKTSRRNTIAAFPADRTGARVGPAIATKRARSDGTWSLWVTLNPNRRNRIVVQAIDPSGNRSHTSALYSVIEDSKKPVVRMLSPKNGATLRFEKKIRWKTYEANKRSVAIFYKKRSASRWQTITTRTADDGVFKWTLPRRKLRGAIFELRVRSTDATGKRGVATVRGLRANFSR